MMQMKWGAIKYDGPNHIDISIFELVYISNDSMYSENLLSY